MTNSQKSLRLRVKIEELFKIAFDAKLGDAGTDVVTPFTSSFGCEAKGCTISVHVTPLRRGAVQK